MHSTPILSRIVLVPFALASISEPTPAVPERPAVRRYRLARAELNRPRDPASVEHLKRIHD
ncbi:MAG: hypothetical protein ACR2HD_03035 [Solirubrobacteraceae bacterium]|nr:MAG: hypothetical protein DLM63_00850 [Solirubrobacterales bacterium]